MRCVSKLWLSARFKVVCHLSGMIRLVPTYCRLCTRILLFNRVEHKNKYDHEVTRKTLPSLCPRLLKKAAALDKKRSLILPNKDGSKITEGLAPKFFSSFWRWHLVIIPRRTFCRQLGQVLWIQVLSVPRCWAWIPNLRVSWMSWFDKVPDPEL